MEMIFSQLVRKVPGKQCKTTTQPMEPIKIHTINLITGVIARSLIKPNRDASNLLTWEEHLPSSLESKEKPFWSKSHATMFPMWLTTTPLQEFVTIQTGLSVKSKSNRRKEVSRHLVLGHTFGMGATLMLVWCLTTRWSPLFHILRWKQSRNICLVTPRFWNSWAKRHVLLPAMKLWKELQRCSLTNLLKTGPRHWLTLICLVITWWSSLLW